MVTEKSDILYVVRIEETFPWMLLHWAGFFIGGSTFVIGTSLYFYPELEYGATWSAGSVFILRVVKD